MLEELVAALPVFASGVLGLIPTTLMERDDSVGEVFVLMRWDSLIGVLYGLFLLMRNIYHLPEASDPSEGPRV